MKHWTRYAVPVCLALLVALLSGCQITASGPMGPGEASPEMAVFQAISGPVRPMPNFQVTPGTVQVVQKVALNDGFIVMVSFRGMRTANDEGDGPQSCLFSYQVLRARLGGWSTGSGGGSCTGAPSGASDAMPMTISGGSSGGGNPGNPGYSTTEGQVFQKDIVTVQVTWNDNQVQLAPVVNGTFIAARIGQFNMLKVEGMDADGKVVYSNETRADPQKQQIEEQKP